MPRIEAVGQLLDAAVHPLSQPRGLTRCGLGREPAMLGKIERDGRDGKTKLGS